MKHAQCPCCTSSSVEDFFTISNAPTQSVVTIKNREEALAIPRSDIVLTFCNNCGFIYNSAFNAEIDYFTQGYEDQQGFSPTFVQFLTAVAERYIDTYDMRGKTVVEIGCGKGDYLKLFCSIGNNKGIGIDPAYVSGRGDEQEDVDFLPEFYEAKHGALNPDCITCRHTLEHIHDTRAFMTLIRESVGTKEPHLFFEVPCITRILDIQAFWDIYSEHCTYLSPGSAARLFRQCGFDVLDMYLEYDEQYLFIEAKASEPSGTIHPMEETVEDLKVKILHFVDQITKQLDEWRTRLEGFKSEGKKVVVWGGGSKSVGFLTQFDAVGILDYVVDINPHMEGNYIPGIGKQYVLPDFLETYKPDVVIVMNSVYMDEIRSSLAERGLHPEMLGL